MQPSVLRKRRLAEAQQSRVVNIQAYCSAGEAIVLFNALSGRSVSDVLTTLIVVNNIDPDRDDATGVRWFRPTGFSPSVKSCL
jgi:hypothetical protein